MASKRLFFIEKKGEILKIDAIFRIIVSLLPSLPENEHDLVMF